MNNFVHDFFVNNFKSIFIIRKKWYNNNGDFDDMQNRQYKNTL